MDNYEAPTGIKPIDLEFAQLFNTYLPQSLKTIEHAKVLSVGCGFAYEAPGLLQALPQAEYRGVDTDESHIKAAIALHPALSSERFKVEVADASQEESLGKDSDLVLVRNPTYSVNRETHKIQTSWSSIFTNCVTALKVGGYMFLTAADKKELEHTMEIIKQDERIQVATDVTQNAAPHTADTITFNDDYIALARRVV